MTDAAGSVLQLPFISCEQLSSYILRLLLLLLLLANSKEDEGDIPRLEMGRPTLGERKQDKISFFLV